jgi:hypothetical protein
MTIIQAKPLKQYGISGPASALDNEIAVFDGVTGKKIKAGSGVLIAKLVTLTDNSIADTLHRHSELVASDGSPDPALSVDADGKVEVSGGDIKLNKPYGIYFGSSSLHQAETGSFTMSVTDGNKNAIMSADESFYFCADHDENGSGDLKFYIGHENHPEQVMVMKNSGNVGLGTISPATSAKLDLTSTTGALLLTRMTTAQKNALTAVNGMVLYDLTTNKFQGYENGAWANLI